MRTNTTKAHAHSSRHKAEVQSGNMCGCFHCLKTFQSTDIRKWIDKGLTALCPHCGIDSVLGSKSGYPVTDPMFLRRMCDKWFS